MKTIKFLLPVFLLLALNLPVFSQKYKTASDTVKLNKEYVKVSNDIAELTSKLTVAQKNLPGYHTRADDADADAQKTADASSQQAYKATSGDMGDARSAKKKARKAYKKAGDAKDANKKIKGQEKKIAKLGAQLHKKEARLQALEDMRLTLRNTPL
jgi:uncharacterized low-complexity protein